MPRTRKPIEFREFAGTLPASRYQSSVADGDSFRFAARYLLGVVGVVAAALLIRTAIIRNSPYSGPVSNVAPGTVIPLATSYDLAGSYQFSVANSASDLQPGMTLSDVQPNQAEDLQPSDSSSNVQNAQTASDLQPAIGSH